MHRPTNYQHLPASERVEISEAIRSARVKEFAVEILEDPQLLDDAVGAFGNEHSFTGLYLCLSAIAQCRTSEQHAIHGAALRQHLQSIAGWYAERETPPVSIFHLPQAG